MPSTEKFTTLKRTDISANGSSIGITTSGRMQLFAVWDRKGETIAKLGFTGVTQPNTQSNLWFALYHKSYALLGQTADQTTTMLTNNVHKRLDPASPVALRYTGLYYVGICMVFTGSPSIRGHSAGNGDISYETPPLCGNSTDSLTTTAPNPTASANGNQNMACASLF